MIKQLYKRKIAVFFGAVIFGVLTSTLPGCAQENSDNTQAAEADSAAEMAFLDHDMVLGDPNAPVEIIEYASLTCNHCATFHNNVLPRIKEKYVDSGKVKIVMRSFLLNAIDATTTLLTRCVPEQRYFRFMDALFTRQTQWYKFPEYQRLSAIHDARTANMLFVDYTIGEVAKIARQVGMNEKKIQACTANQKISEYIYSIHQEGIEKYKVTATPTIIVNGNKAGNDYASIERAIEAALD